MMKEGSMLRIIKSTYMDLVGVVDVTINIIIHIKYLEYKLKV